MLSLFRSGFAANRVGVAHYYVPAAERACYGYRERKTNPLPQESPEVTANKIKNANLVRLCNAYRSYGHMQANTNPIQDIKVPMQNLQPERYGFDMNSSQKFNTTGILHFADGKPHEADIKTIVEQLQKSYCGLVSFEFMHALEREERAWFEKTIEESVSFVPSADQRRKMVDLLIQCEVFDNFMQTRFGNVKRYGAEGAESMVVLMDQLFSECANYNVKDVLMAMPHRGRLNFLAGLLKFPLPAFFHKLSGKSELPDGVSGSGDVISHIFQTTKLEYGDSNVVASLIANPSHLEAANPVVVGKTRGRQQWLQDGDYKYDSSCNLGDKALCVQIHGDAAFPAQGVVPETLLLSGLPHFTVGGSVHVIVNNQLGFTTGADRGRFTRYSSDIVKMINCPVLHVNGDNPDEVVRASNIAMKYRMQFRKDIVLDMMCFRRRGHNELDDPRFTQPLMYTVIDKHTPVPKLYAESLKQDGIVDDEYLISKKKEFWAQLDAAMKAADSHVVKANHLTDKWASLTQAGNTVTHVDTGFNTASLKDIGKKSVDIPKDVNVHRRLVKSHVNNRLKQIEDDKADWATCEAMAFGSLMLEGHHVRISGQDVGRGTFSHRHAMLVDQNTDAAVVPLNYMDESQKGFLELANSPLSELAVLGFEYGMSIENPNNLCIWEAQFGDFFNGAQVIIDTYLASGETKWLRQSGLVLLLPHGFEGAGPEHSSCRLERWLQLCDSAEDKVDGDNVNMNVVNPSTPAQYFHLLRRQIKRNYRKPLIVAAPKVLLRLPAARSSLAEMGEGTSFQPVLGDAAVDPTKVSKVVLCSGKIYYELAQKRSDLGLDDIAIIRVEELCPFPAQTIKAEISKFTNAKEFVWCQEEQRNAGAWTFVRPRLEDLCGIKPQYVGRPTLAAVAVGVPSIHRAEVQEIASKIFF